jgi:hypothetical protein
VDRHALVVAHKQQSGQVNRSMNSMNPQLPLLHEQGKTQALPRDISAWQVPKLHQLPLSHSPAQPSTIVQLV